MTKEGLEKLDFLLSGLIDKEHYEWHNKMDAERIERFEPPMWEEFENRYLFRWFREILTYTDETFFFVDKKQKIMYIGNMHPGINHYEFSAYNEEFTKENYIKACEMVRDLFNKGDKE